MENYNLYPEYYFDILETSRSSNSYNGTRSIKEKQGKIKKIVRNTIFYKKKPYSWILIRIFKLKCNPEPHKFFPITKYSEKMLEVDLWTPTLFSKTLLVNLRNSFRCWGTIKLSLPLFWVLPLAGQNTVKGWEAKNWALGMRIYPC